MYNYTKYSFIIFCCYFGCNFWNIKFNILNRIVEQAFYTANLVNCSGQRSPTDNVLSEQTFLTTRQQIDDSSNGTCPTYCPNLELVAMWCGLVFINSVVESKQVSSRHYLIYVYNIFKIYCWYWQYIDILWLIYSYHVDNIFMILAIYWQYVAYIDNTLMILAIYWQYVAYIDNILLILPLYWLYIGHFDNKFTLSW